MPQGTLVIVINNTRVPWGGPAPRMFYAVNASFRYKNLE